MSSETDPVAFTRARRGRRGRADQPAADEIVERILDVSARHARDPPAAPRHNERGTPLDPIEMLAQAIMELPHADLVLPTL